MTIPDQFPTIPDHNTVRPADNHSCEKTYINAFALFVPTSSERKGQKRITLGYTLLPLLCRGMCEDGKVTLDYIFWLTALPLYSTFCTSFEPARRTLKMRFLSMPGYSPLTSPMVRVRARSFHFMVMVEYMPFS